MPEIKSMAVILSGSFSSWLEATACGQPQIVADSDSGHEKADNVSELTSRCRTLLYPL